MYSVGIFNSLWFTSHYSLKVVQVITLHSLFLLSLFYCFYCCIVCWKMLRVLGPMLCVLGPGANKHKIMYCVDMLPQFSGSRN